MTTFAQDRRGHVWLVPVELAESGGPVKAAMFVAQLAPPDGSGAPTNQQGRGLRGLRLMPRVVRHGTATLHLGAGVHPHVAQQLLRPASSKTTTEIYSHVTAAQERPEAEVLEAALAG